MTRMLRVRISGPLEPYAQGFAVELERLGYTAGSAGHQLRLLAHLSRWLDAQGRSSGQLTVDEMAGFVTLRREAGRTVYRSMSGVAPLVDYLSSLALIVPTAAVSLRPADELLERYRGYLLRERGLVASTAGTYLSAIRPFVTVRAARGEIDLATLTAGEVTAFLLEICEQQPGRAQTTATALRSLLGFLQAEGLVGSSLAGGVRSVASWKLSSLPRGLEPGEVVRLLAACDRRTSIGRRDVAMLLLLVRLGLRAGEVAALELDDLDWRAGEVVVTGKGDRHERLPLPDDVGRAVVGYLQRGRPAGALDRALFVRIKAPHRRLTSEAVSARVCAAARRGGLGDVRAHRLRHTAATSMLAAGAPLVEIGQLLRHRKALTTAIYANPRELHQTGEKRQVAWS